MDTSARASSPAADSIAIPPEEMFRLIGTPNGATILDVRREAVFATSPYIFPAAIRCRPEDVAAYAASHTRGKIIAYCVYGHNVSFDAAVELRKAGWEACHLAGGIEGGQDGADEPSDIEKWRNSPRAVICKRPDLGVTGEHASRWITRSRPKIDRIACPWLVRRFIDPRAEFFYVEAAQVFSEATRRNAVAYDLPNAPITHVGEQCSFDSLLRAFELDRIPSLALLAQIVRGADTDQLQLTLQSAGLLAISMGLSAIHSADDLAMLEAAMPIYDALFAWCKSKVDGLAEPHSWNPVAAPGARK